MTGLTVCFLLIFLDDFLEALCGVSQLQRERWSRLVQGAVLLGVD